MEHLGHVTCSKKITIKGLFWKIGNFDEEFTQLYESKKKEETNITGWCAGNATTELNE